jgi:hypothetical protein
MSKRLKNYPDPAIIATGAAAPVPHRLACRACGAAAIRGEGRVGVVKDVFLPWYNAYRFPRSGALRQSDILMMQVTLVVSFQGCSRNIRLLPTVLTCMLPQVPQRYRSTLMITLAGHFRNVWLKATTHKNFSQSSTLRSQNFRCVQYVGPEHVRCRDSLVPQTQIGSAGFDNNVGMARKQCRPRSPCHDII